MNQYTPPPFRLKWDNLNRRLSPDEYDALIDYAVDLGWKTASPRRTGRQRRVLSRLSI